MDLEAAGDQVILQIEAGGKRWLLRSGDCAVIASIGGIFENGLQPVALYS